MSKSITCHGSCGAVWRWEDASETLATALGVYLRACTFLETSSFADKESAKALASRIDSSLGSLHIQMAQQLTQSRVTLARVRNTIASPIYSLPNDILAKIFMGVIQIKISNKNRPPWMTTTLETMYKDLHNLLAVCKSWRDVGISHQRLWSVIPMVEARMWSYKPQTLATDLSLKRAGVTAFGNHNIHLVAALGSGHDAKFPIMKHPGMDKIPHFRSINIQCESISAIAALFTRFRPYSYPNGVTELSLFRPRNEKEQNKPYYAPSMPRASDYIIASYYGEDVFKVLVESASILRLRGVNICFDQAFFSRQNLVELRLQDIGIGHNSMLTRILWTLSTAAELRTLQFITIVSFPDPSESSTPEHSNLLFPKLETLLLQDLNFNVLQLVSASIASGSHRTKLYLTSNSTRMHHTDREPQTIALGDLYQMLNQTMVHTLIVDGDWSWGNWLEGSELSGLLQSVPGLKSLKIHDWSFGREYLEALQPPLSRTKSSKSRSVPFPKLEMLHLSGRIEDQGSLRRIVTSHSLKELELAVRVNVPTKDHGGFEGASASEALRDGTPFAEELRTLVPQVRIISDSSVLDDLNQGIWQLW